MGAKTRLAANFICLIGFAVLAAAGFAYWGIALHAGDPTGQVFGIVVGGIFGVMWLAFFFVKVEEGKPAYTRRSYRY